MCRECRSTEISKGMYTFLPAQVIERFFITKNCDLCKRNQEIEHELDWKNVERWNSISRVFHTIEFFLIELKDTKVQTLFSWKTYLCEVFGATDLVFLFCKIKCLCQALNWNTWAMFIYYYFLPSKSRTIAWAERNVCNILICLDLRTELLLFFYLTFLVSLVS